MPPRPAPVRVLDAAFLAGAARLDQLPPPVQIEVAFSGRSNVGKSTLMNMMLARKNLVRTSSTPGCTRQVNLFSCALAGGVSLVLADLPGYGYAKVSKTESRAWAKTIEGYLAERATLRVVVVLVDVRRGMEAEERDLVDFLARSREGRGDVDVLVVATKIDKLPGHQRKPALAALRKEAGVPVLGASGVTGAGRDELWEAILAALRPPPDTPFLPPSGKA
jgi:GTP-binding protein